MGGYRGGIYTFWGRGRSPGEGRFERQEGKDRGATKISGTPEGLCLERSKETHRLECSEKGREKGQWGHSYPYSK